ncbi:hypothetical protein ACTXT7_011885 [Hymenolepis weldensis]
MPLSTQMIIVKYPTPLFNSLKAMHLPLPPQNFSDNDNIHSPIPNENKYAQAKTSMLLSNEIAWRNPLPILEMLPKIGLVKELPTKQEISWYVSSSINSIGHRVRLPGQDYGFDSHWPTPIEWNGQPHWLSPANIEEGYIQASHQDGSLMTLSTLEEHWKTHL